MADQQSTQAALSSAVNTYFEKKHLESFEPSTAWYASAPVRADIPEGGGNIIEFTRYKKVDYLNSNNSDEFTAQQLYLSAETVQATLHQRDGFIKLSRKLVLTAISKPLERAAEKVKFAAAKTVDILVRNDIGMCVADVAAASSVNMDNLAIDGGTLNSTGITARVWSHDQAAAGDRFPMYHNKTRLAQSSTVVSFAKTAMTVKTIQAGVNVLAGNDVSELDSGKYCLISHPTISYQTTTNPGFKGWISPTSSTPLTESPNMDRVVAGVNIKTTTLGYRFPLSGDTLSTASGALFCSLLFGDEAYGVSEISGESGGAGYKFYLKESGAQTTADPTNMIKTAGFSVLSVAKVLNKSAGLWILTTEQT